MIRDTQAAKQELPMSQIAYQVRLHIGTTVAEAIPAEVTGRSSAISAPAVDSTACRYRVDRVECPDFNPTITPTSGTAVALVGSIPHAIRRADPNAVVLSISGGRSLDDVWATARVILAERARIAAEQSQPVAGASKSRLARADDRPRACSPWDAHVRLWHHWPRSALASWRCSEDGAAFAAGLRLIRTIHATGNGSGAAPGHASENAAAICGRR